MGDERPGRMPTMADVALRAGVSRQLVSLVLRRAAGPSDASRERVLRAAEEIGFRLNVSARLLRQGRSGLIGVLFAAQNPFEARFVERLLERAHDIGYGVVLGPITDRRTTDVVIAELLEHRVEAIAAFNPDPLSKELDSALGTMPVVWLGELGRDRRADIVRTDQDTGMRLLVTHLAALGHRRIAYVGGLGGVVGPDRAAAYRAAMEASGLGAEIDEVPVGFEEEEGARAARTLLARDRLPTAVVCCSDQCAVGVLAVLARAHVDVPGAVSVTGYDDSSVAAFSFNDLTAVRQDVELTVDAVLDAVVARMTDPGYVPRDVATEATLTIRGSTGAVRAGA